MPDLIIRPSSQQAASAGKPWALQIRRHDCVGPVEYEHIAYLTDDAARAIEGETARPLFESPSSARGGKKAYE